MPGPSQARSAWTTCWSNRPPNSRWPGKIRDSGVTVLLIEHVMHAVMSLSEYIYVLSYGKIIAQGTPQEVVNNQAVVEAYLGRGSTLPQDDAKPGASHA
jgi:ABC-type multidrug transport system ATPase subunit